MLKGLKKQLCQRILADDAFRDCAPVVQDAFDKSRLDPPPAGQPGDVATNVAFLMAKPLKQSPLQVAEALKAVFQGHELVDFVSIAKPGFLNLSLKFEAWQDTLKTILQKKEAFGSSTVGAGKKVNVEYVSANPTGPLHLAHGRGAVVGDALARLLAQAGFEVTREFYVNDAGEQIKVLAQSLYARYQEAITGKPVDLPPGCYPGEYLKEVAAALIQADGDKWMKTSEDQWMPALGDFGIQFLLGDIKKTLGRLGISYDVFTSEKGLHDRDMLRRAIDVLDSKGLVYKGTLPPPKGKAQQDWVPQELTLFKASAFGQKEDAPLLKEGDVPTYFGGDVGYHQDKLDREFDQLVNVWGADHAAHVGRLAAAVQALSGQKGVLHTVLCQIVHVMKDGQPFKMSKRAGTFILLDDLLDEVGPDVLRFMLISKTTTAHMTLQVEELVKTSQDNPVFYVLYAYARGCSVMRAAEEIWGKDAVGTLGDADLAALKTATAAFPLMQKLAFWPMVLEGAALAFEPHRITIYLQEVARAFHALWSQGKTNTTMRFIQEDNPSTSRAFLALVQAMLYILQQALGIIGVPPRQELFA